MIMIEDLDDPRIAKPMLRVLRDKIDEVTFDARLTQAVAQGYKVSVARIDGEIVGAMGHRIVEDLCWGRSLFVDDLVVDPAHRGGGIGAALLAHAKTMASRDCDHLRLCSGLIREDAHRFYEAHGVARCSYQFVARS